MGVARLRRDAETPFRISAEPAELTELARFLGVERIERVSLAGFIAPAVGDGWRVRGRLVAKIVQSCVITLAAVKTRIEMDIERLYLPSDSLAAEKEVQVMPEEDEAPDPFTDSIDPAALAVESLALMIDPYPRAEGAALGEQSFAAPGAAPLSEKASHPFASLAVLKQRGARDDD